MRAFTVSCSQVVFEIISGALSESLGETAGVGCPRQRAQTLSPGEIPERQWAPGSGSGQGLCCSAKITVCPVGHILMVLPLQFMFIQ